MKNDQSTLSFLALLLCAVVVAFAWYGENVSPLPFAAPPSEAPQIQKLGSRLDAVEKMNAGLKLGLEALYAQQVQQQGDLSNATINISTLFLLAQNQDEQAAVISANSTDYGMIKNPYGSFPVFIKTISPYLDGYKVTLWVGNPFDAYFTGASVVVKWGAKSSAPIVIETLKSNAWNPVDIVMSPAQASELSDVRVSMHIAGVSLLQPPSPEN